MTVIDTLAALLQPVPPPPDECALLEQLLEAEAEPGALRGLPAARLVVRQVPLDIGENGPLSLQSLCDRPDPGELAGTPGDPDFYTSKEEIRIREAALAARGRVDAGELAELDPQRSAEARVVAVRAAPEEHRVRLHPAAGGGRLR